MDVLSLPFIQHAILAGILASVACGIIGSLVVVNRSVFLAGGIAHAAYGGVGLAFFLSLPPLPCIIGFSLFMALIMAAFTVERRHRMDTFIGVLWAVGMATGIILIDLSPGYNVDLMSFLFGSILTVPVSDIKVMAAVDILIIGAMCGFYKEFLAMSYDMEFARVRGLPVRLFHFLFMALVALAVVMTIRVVGLILVMALFTIAPYLTERFSASLAGMMVTSTIANIVFVFTGLWISYRYNLTSGATIILVAALFFMIFIILSRFASCPRKP
ncbi:MAG: metal ABC transporter permease [Thermodesulfatator sp.]|nr:MAG: metal ABC transporter permease [Thermodesulfatator sp.]